MTTAGLFRLSEQEETVEKTMLTRLGPGGAAPPKEFTSL
jgi:hypothetical protein